MRPFILTSLWARARPRTIVRPPRVQVPGESGARPIVGPGLCSGSSSDSDPGPPVGVGLHFKFVGQSEESVTRRTTVSEESFSDLVEADLD